MSELLKAADEARRLLRGFTALQTVADALEQTGRLEQAKAEAETALAQLREDIVHAKSQREGYQNESESLLNNAREQAATIVSEARQAANDVLLSANEQVAGVLKEADAKLATAELRVSIADKQVASATIQRDTLQAECDEIESRIEQAKAHVAKLLGG